MPLNARNTRTASRGVLSSCLKSVRLLKRGDDQRQNQVTEYLLFGCRRGQITRTGEPIQGDMGSDHRTTWHIPARELERVGLRYLNPADRIVEDHDDMNRPLVQSIWRYWQPEADTTITSKLFENEIDVECLRVDPTR